MGIYNEDTMLKATPKKCLKHLKGLINSTTLSF
jgi:hypothetical protein